MRSKTPQASQDSVAAGSIEQALVSLKLTVGAKDPDQSRRLDKVLEVLRDVVSVPNFYSSGGECEEQEAAWWEMFAEVFASEVAAQARASGGKEPSAGCKRQILADILVWAEVTQDHYDSGTQRFVTEPHDADESFQRIGRTFRAAKARKGLGSGGGGGGCGSGGCGGGGAGDGAGVAGANAGARCVTARRSESSADSECSSETRS